MLAVDYAIYMIDPRAGGELEFRRGALRATRPTRSSASLLATSTPPRTGPPACPERARDRGAEGPLSRPKAGGSARTEPLLGLVVLDAIRDENGELIGFAKITRDMTERQQAQQSLLESESRFRRLVEAVVDYAIFQLDPDGHRHDLERGRAADQGL